MPHIAAATRHRPVNMRLTPLRLTRSFRALSPDEDVFRQSQSGPAQVVDH
jgi:hypothetical protein